MTTAIRLDRIVSFLPSATEIVYALGLGDRMVGRTFECDYPAAAHHVPVMLDSTIPTGLSPAEIDDFVNNAGGSEGLYTIRDDVKAAAPDIILTQDLCGVCAVPVGDVERALQVLECQSEVVSLDPNTLTEVIDVVDTVGHALGVPERSSAITTNLRQRLAAVEQAVAGLPRPKVAVIEWIDPPFGSGHWIPHMIEAAGGEAVLAYPGTPSTPLSWEEVGASGAEILLVCPCGYYLGEAVEQARSFAAHPALAQLPAVQTGQVYAIDATSVVTRPGPRVIDGVEAFAAIIHPETVPDRPELLQKI